MPRWGRRRAELVIYTALCIHCQHNYTPSCRGENMARQPDPDLEARILNAARKLWRKGAGKALTMRAVARAAGTNTPAAYRRLPHRPDIRRALFQSTRQE